MFCKNCGQEINDGIRFCPACGSVQDAEQVAPAAEATAPVTDVVTQQQITTVVKAPMDPQKKKMILIAAAAVIVVVVLLIVFLGKGGNGGSGKVNAATPEEAAQAVVKADYLEDEVEKNRYWFYDMIAEEVSEAEEEIKMYAQYGASENEILQSLASMRGLEGTYNSVSSLINAGYEADKEERAEELKERFGDYTITTEVESTVNYDSDSYTFEDIVDYIDRYYEDEEIDTSKITECVEVEVELAIECEDGTETVDYDVMVIKYDDNWRVYSCY